MELIVELDDAGIVIEHAHAPVVVAQTAANFLGGGKDGLFEKIRIRSMINVRCPTSDVRRQKLYIDRSLERFVGTMLRPGLGDCFQLDIGGIAPQRLKMTLDRLHLKQIKG